MRPQARGPLITGVVLILLGALFLLINLADRLFDRLDIGFDVWKLWPMILILVGLAFFLPILLSWEQRRTLAGFAIPGTIFLVNGFLLLYQSLSGDWDSWAYAWAFEPIAVGLGLFLTYLLSGREPGFLVGAGIVGGVGIFFLMIFGSAFGGPIIGTLGGLLLILVGFAVLLAGFLRRTS